MTYNERDDFSSKENQILIGGISDDRVVGCSEQSDEDVQENDASRCSPEVVLNKTVGIDDESFIRDTEGAQSLQRATYTRKPNDTLTTCRTQANQASPR